MKIASETVYQRRMVAFLDVLGFRSLILAAEADITLRRSLQALLTSLNRYATEKFLGGEETEAALRELEKEFELEKKLEVKENKTSAFHRLLTGQADPLSADMKDYMESTMFSDSIVISGLLDSKYPASGFSLLNITSSCMIVARELLDRGYLVRGAICFGELYHDGPVVFGPAMVEAYDLERNYAIHPRIILSEKAVVLLDDFACIARDADGKKYLKIFNHQDTEEKLNKFRTQVTQGYSCCANSHERSKWMWMQQKLDDELISRSSGPSKLDE